MEPHKRALSSSKDATPSQPEPQDSVSRSEDVRSWDTKTVAVSTLAGALITGAPAVVSALAGPQAGFATATAIALGTGIATRNLLKGLGAWSLGTYATRFGQGGLATGLGFAGVATAGFAAAPVVFPELKEHL